MVDFYDDAEKTLSTVAHLAENESVGLRVAFEKGHAPGEHSHNHGQIVYSPTHLITVVASGKAWLSSPDVAVWIPPRKMHRVNAADDRCMDNIYLTPKLSRPFPDAPSGIYIRLFLRTLIEEICAGRRRSSDEQQGLLRVAISEAIYALIPPESVQPAVQFVFQDKRLQKIADALMDDPSVNRNIESWAADLGVSRRTLTRLVKSETGIGWREWRQRLLMAEAARRLAAGGLVKTIAYDLGYAGAAPFIAAFRRLYGISPGRAYSRKTQK